MNSNFDVISMLVGLFPANPLLSFVKRLNQALAPERKISLNLILNGLQLHRKVLNCVKFKNMILNS